jgi:hypothetical protein
MKKGHSIFAALSLLGVLVATPLAAQPDSGAVVHSLRTDDLWSVGAQFGLTTGTGVTVRYLPAGRFACALTVGGFRSSENWTYSIGGEAQFDFDIVGRSRFYGFAGAGYYYTGETTTTGTPPNEVKNTENSLDGPFRMGIGAGYEWDLSRVLLLNVNLALTYFSDGKFYPMPQAGIHYTFR